jgi:hypothetical protein
MKRLIGSLLIALTIPLAACATYVVARPPHRGMVLVEGAWVYPPRYGAVWVPAHYVWRGYHRVWVAGYWRY